LDLSNNQLSGPIPPELGNLYNLRGLGLNNNELSGQVPLPVAQAGARADEEDGCDFRGNDALFIPKAPAYQLLAPTICGLPLREVLWFEDSLPGTVLTEASAGSGFGPVKVAGKKDRCKRNAAVVFDSGHPTGGDFDLGTPNEAFGGPGRGRGGSRGSYRNDTALGNLLILHRRCGELAGVVEDPEDTDGGGTISLTFPEPVTLYSYTAIDRETREQHEEMHYGEGGVFLARLVTPATGDNGKAVVVANAADGIAGVLRMVVDRTGSVGLDNIVFSADAEMSKQAEGPDAVPPAEAIATFALEEAYPNPFNPRTMIQYTLPEPAQVSLVVYDVQGRERAVLVSSAQPAGRYEVAFDAGGLPSGLYLYRLTAGAYHATRTMILMR
jgi:hypothetical protein